MKQRITDSERTDHTFVVLDLLDDAEFMAALQANDGRMRNLVHRMINHRDETEDVLQEAYLKAHRSRSTLAGDADAFGAWLYRITYNTALDHLRRRRRGNRRTDSADLHEVPDPSIAIDDVVVTRTAVRAAMTELRPEWAAAIVLVDLESMSFAEAANVLGVPIGTTSTYVNRGRARLRHLLSMQDRS